MARTIYGNHERYHSEPAAAGAGHRRTFVYFRILAGLFQKGLRPLSGTGHHPQGTEQRDQIQPDILCCTQPFHRGGSVRAHCGAGQRVGMVAAVGHRFSVLRDYDLQFHCAGAGLRILCGNAGKRHRTAVRRGDDPDERGYAERFPDPAAPRQKAVQERGPLCSRKRRQHLEKRAVRRVHACDVLGIHSHSAVH